MRAFLLFAFFLATISPAARAQTAIPTKSSPDPGAFLALSPQWWVKLSGGYDYAFMGDLNTASRNYANYLKEVGAPVTDRGLYQTGNSGIRAGLELGYSLDRDNWISLGAQNVWTQAMGWSQVQDNTVVESFMVSPNLLSVSLNYGRNLIQSKWGKTYLAVGGGWYHAYATATSYDNLIPPPNDYSTGTFTGDVLGGTLGLSQSVNLGGPFALELSVNGRWASFSQLSSNSVNGNYISGPPFKLMVLRNENIVPGMLGSDSDYLLFAPQGIMDMHPGDYRYAVVDYSGLFADIAFRYSF